MPCSQHPRTRVAPGTPVAVTCIAGNAEEEDMLIANRERLRHHHDCKVEIDIADSKFDATKNYEYIRGEGSIPIIDYNPRNENLSKEALLKRGYDQNGWPFAPCGLLCRPNGFDKDRQRLTFCCFRHWPALSGNRMAVRCGSCLSAEDAAEKVFFFQFGLP